VLWQVGVFRRIGALKRRFLHGAAGPLATLREGRAVIEGRASPLELLRAPISGAEVIGFRVTVERARQRGDEGSWWEEVFDYALIRDFEIDDGSARVLVRTAGARLILEREYRRRSGLLNDVPPQLRHLLSQRGRGLGSWLSSEQLRWSEAFLEPGEVVCVSGHARLELDPGAAGSGYRAAPQRTVIGPPADGPLIVVDRSRSAFLKEF
jgi:hypothetical protein